MENHELTAKDVFDYIELAKKVIEAESEQLFNEQIAKHGRHLTLSPVFKSKFEPNLSKPHEIVQKKEKKYWKK